ncbi:MAG: FAD-dependent oxidoreductase [Phycisphaeraceae bacterium]|nr:FAD-dependent oxidoreductase [Phycisphaeraceae bacterium]
MKIVVIGAGISGLVASWQLARRHDVTLLEARNRLGGHTHTVTVDDGGRSRPIDTGFIVFNRHNYPRFSALLEQLNIPSHPTDMSLSVRCDQTGLEWQGSSLNGLFATRRSLIDPSFYRMLRDILRFADHARALLETPPGPTVAEFVRDHGYGRRFVRHYLRPLGTALWSCSGKTFDQFSMRLVASFLDHHRMLDLGGRPTWRVVTGGSRRYVDAIARQLEGHIRTGCPVERVRRRPGAVDVHLQSGEILTADHVVLACHADQALRMVEQPTDTEQQLLRCFPYEANEAILHHDTRVMPRRRRAWASWNVRVPDDPTEPGPVAVTYWMNRLMGLADARHDWCVTLNDDRDIAPETIAGRFRYDHPQMTLEREAAGARQDQLIDHDRLSYCGAYWGWGFHEDGVRSAENVVEALADHPTDSRPTATPEVAHA